MGPFDQTASWSMESIRGCNKFLDRIWNLQDIVTSENAFSKEHDKLMNKAIKKVSQDIEAMKFNTCVSTFMEMVNAFYKDKFVTKKEFEIFLQLLNPFAPHITEELNQKLGNKEELAYIAWPTYDEEKTHDDEINLPVQVNGKLRANVLINKDEEESSVKEKVHANERIQSFTDGKQIVKEIYVPNRIYNIVIK